MFHSFFALALSILIFPISDLNNAEKTSTSNSVWTFYFDSVFNSDGSTNFIDGELILGYENEVPTSIILKLKDKNYMHDIDKIHQINSGKVLDAEFLTHLWMGDHYDESKHHYFKIVIHDLNFYELDAQIEYKLDYISNKSIRIFPCQLIANESNNVIASGSCD